MYNDFFLSMYCKFQHLALIKEAELHRLYIQSNQSNEQVFKSLQSTHAKKKVPIQHTKKHSAIIRNKKSKQTKNLEV